MTAIEIHMIKGNDHRERRYGIAYVSATMHSLSGKDTSRSSNYLVEMWDNAHRPTGERGVMKDPSGNPVTDRWTYCVTPLPTVISAATDPDAPKMGGELKIGDTVVLIFPGGVRSPEMTLQARQGDRPRLAPATDHRASTLTPEQLEIWNAAAALLNTLDRVVPRSTAHHAVENARSAAAALQRQAATVQTCDFNELDQLATDAIAARAQRAAG